MAFHFQQFSIQQDRCSMKVGTDGVLLGAWSKVLANDQILDIGTGTGLIALMLTQKERTANVTGIEIDKAAATQAADNVAQSPFVNNVQIEARDVQSYSRSQPCFYDLVVSNPPFFTAGVLSDNKQRSQVRHTVKLSHGDLLRSVQLLLNPRGRFCLILPWTEGLQFQKMALTYQLFVTRKCIVHPRPNRPPNRLLLQFERKEKVIQETAMSIYAQAVGEERSELFQELTNAYYLVKSKR